MRARPRNNGLEARISREETKILITTSLGEIPPIITRTSVADRTSHMRIIVQILEDQLINAQISHLTETMKIDLEMDLLATQMGIGGTMEIFQSTQRRVFSQNISYRQLRSDQSTNFAFRRSDNRPPTGFTSYEQKFPQNNNQTSSNVVRFTTTDDTINELSDFCPLSS